MSHTHKTNSRVIRSLGLLTTVIFGVITILGSGGGSDGGSTAVTPVTYTGIKDQALITATNAQALGEVAYMGATVGTSITVASVQPTQQGETRSASVVSIVRTLHAVMNSIDVSSATGSIPAGWTETLLQPGNCTGAPGTVSGSLVVNENPAPDPDRGTFTGNLVFADYCLSPTGDPADGLTMDGPVAFNGTCDAATFDPATQTCDIISYTMTFTNLNTRGFGESQTISGTLTSAITASGYDTTVNMLLRDDNANVTFKFENYLIAVTENSPIGYDSIEVSGKAYHPSYGYVDVSTLTPVQVTTGSVGQPELGVIQLTGAIPAGAVLPTTATFTFYAGDFYDLDIDTNGDGAVDVSLTCSWSSGLCS